MKKKLMAVLLSLAMVTSMAPEATAFASNSTVTETDETLLSESDYDAQGSTSEEGQSSENGTLGMGLPEGEAAASGISGSIEGETPAADEETVPEEVVSDDAFADDTFKYKKISDSEVAIVGVSAENLREINIPAEVIYNETAYAVKSIEADALTGQTAEAISIPAGVTEFGAQILPGLKTITVDEFNEVLYVKDGVLFAKTEAEDKNVLVLYPAASEKEHYIVPAGTGEIAEMAFAGAANLKMLVIGDGVTKIAPRAVMSAANAMEIAFAFYTAPTEIAENAFYLDGADGNILYFRSEADYQAVREIQPAFAESPAMYDASGEPIEDTSSVISIVTSGIPDRIQAIIDSESDVEKDVEEAADESSAAKDKAVTDSTESKVTDDSSTSSLLKDKAVSEEAIGAGPKELDAYIASGYYSLRSNAVNKYFKIRNASIRDSADSYLAAYGSDMGATLSIIPNGDGSYRIIATCSNKALTLSAAAGEGVSVIQKSYTGANDQLWYIRELSSGVYTIHPASNDSFVLDTKNNATASGTAIVLGKKDGAKTQGWELISRKNPTADHLENGIYTIATSLEDDKVVDIDAASTASGANAQIYDKNGTEAQQFILRYLGYGNLYRIINVGSNKALDTDGSKTNSGANVEQATQSSSSATQIWRIVKTNNGTYVIFNAGADKVLDLANGKTANSTNIRIASWSNVARQKWTFSPVSGTAAVDVSGEDAKISAGWYTLSSARTARKIVVKNSSIANNADVLIQNEGLGERSYFYVEPVGNEKYEIKAFCSNKLLTCAWGADSVDAGNLVQSSDSNLSTQRWYIRVSKKNKNYLSIVSASDQNYVLSLKNNDAKWGTSATVGLSKGLNGQRWKLNAISNPNLSMPYNGATYKIQTSENSSILLSTEGQSKQNMANIQLMKKVNGAGEFWNFYKVGYGNLYRITNAYTGLSIDAKNGGTSNGTNIWQHQKNDSDAQLWRVMPTDSSKTKFVIMNAASGKALDVANGTIAVGTNIQLYTQNNTAAQSWTFSRANINTYIPVNTSITLRQKGDTNYLVEVKNGSTDNGATVQANTESGNTDQVFVFVKKDTSIYKIKNAASGKYLDIKSTAAKSAVISTSAKNIDSQLWKVLPTGDNDASFYILNVKTGYALTSSNKTGATVTQSSYTKAKNQKFYFDTPNIKTGWQQVGSNWRYYDNNGNAYRDAFLENGKYYFDANGNVLTGWKKYGAYYYYFRGKTGREYTDNRPYIGSLYGLTTGKYNNQTRPNCPYYYTIDTSRCVVTWYTKYPGTNDFNVPVVAFLCSPGKSSTPTDSGARMTGYIKRWIPLMGPSWGQYGTECKTYTINPGTGAYGYINTGEYFHSIACGSANTSNLNPNTYNLLGTKQSHGCIRLGVRNAYWIFNFVDAGTTGVCREGGLAAPLNTLPQPWATYVVDPTDPNYTGNWGYTDSYATVYSNGAYIPRG